MQSLSRAEHDRLTREINQLHRDVNTHGWAMLEKARDAGERLVVKKQMLGHGNWLPWIEAEFEGSQRTAWAYMHVCHNWGQIEAYRDANQKHASNLSVRGFIRFLNPPSEEDSANQKHASNLEPASPPTHEIPEGRDRRPIDDAGDPANAPRDFVPRGQADGGRAALPPQADGPSSAPRHEEDNLYAPPPDPPQSEQPPPPSPPPKAEVKGKGKQQPKSQKPDRQTVKDAPPPKPNPHEKTLSELDFLRSVLGVLYRLTTSSIEIDSFTYSTSQLEKRFSSLLGRLESGLRTSDDLRLCPPTLDDCTEVALSQGLTEDDARAYYDARGATGWTFVANYVERAVKSLPHDLSGYTRRRKRGEKNQQANGKPKSDRISVHAARAAHSVEDSARQTEEALALLGERYPTGNSA